MNHGGEDVATKVVGVRFKRAGKVYYFHPGDLELEVGDQVVVETTRGQEMGRVVIGSRQVLASELSEPLRPVLRRAEPEDLRQMANFKGKEQEVLEKCKERVHQHVLSMKLVAAEYSFDGSRLTFFFTAEGRVDFRELVRDLAAVFRTRIELRQIGVRDEAKTRGGLGRCGRPLCCASFLTEFAPVSIKMAKEQDLPLNPAKISGLCGRLLCCLGYECENYMAVRESLPRPDEVVSCSLGCGRVVGINVLKETVSIELDSKAIVEVPGHQVTRGEAQKDGPGPASWGHPRRGR